MPIVSAGDVAVLSPIVKSTARCGRVTSSSGSLPLSLCSSASDGTRMPIVPTLSCLM